MRKFCMLAYAKAILARAILCALCVLSFVSHVTGYEAPAGPAAGRPAEKLPVPKGLMVLKPFDYKGVTLYDSRLKDQLDAVKREYLSIPNDDLLKGFRQRAGFPSPGNDLGGWYSGDVFHIFGQIVGGLSRLYAATGDPACRDKADYLVCQWAKCIAPDGYFYYSRKPNAPHYTYEKTAGGLVDAYRYCGNQQALQSLGRITDWAIKNLDRERKYAFNHPSGNTEWFTLTENLYRAYLFTGDVKYKDFGALWEYTDYWNRYARNEDVFKDYLGRYHAYSHVNNLNGAAAAYLVSGEKHYLDTLVHAYDYLTTRQTYATGGYGQAESLKRNYDDLIASLNNEATFETQCGSWAVFKLVKYLLSFTGDARFGDWVELLTYNGIGASPAMHPAGCVQYYSSYNVYNGVKANNNGVWTCCAGTRPEAVADYCALVWFQDASALYVNLYTPSAISWNCRGVPVTVSQQGVLEEDKGIEFAVSSKAAVNFGLKFRVPGWIAAPMSVLVNHQEISAKVDSRHWLAVERTWKDGDKVTVKLPLGLHVRRLDPSKAYPAAILYGPIVLVGPTSGKKQASKLDLTDINSQLEAVSSGTATFRLKADKSVVLRPYYAFAPGEDYFMYIDPQMADYDMLKFVGRWGSGRGFRYSDRPGASVECAFVGSGIRWAGARYDDAGRAEISIDGKIAAVVDQYGPGRGLPFAWEHKGLAPGKHLIRLRVLGEKSESSRGAFVNIRSLIPVEGARSAPAPQEAARPRQGARDAKKKRPNILLALSDDQGYPHASAYGCAMVKTPAFDRVAKEGILFHHAYCAAPTCTASRSALLTGRYPWQLEEAANLLCDNFQLKYKTYPDILENAGYHVGYTGKGWGPGSWSNNGRPRNPAGNKYNLGGDYFANFELFLKNRKPGQPFCFWFGALQPHRGYKRDSGIAAGKKTEDVLMPGYLPDDPEQKVRRDWLDYALAIEVFDGYLGQIINKLEEIGELDDTLIVVTGDNGPPFPRIKSNCYEQGNHAPMAIRWGKGAKGGRVVDDLVGFIDLAPTFLEAAGLPLPTAPKEEVMTGRSLMNILESSQSGRIDPHREYVMTGRERHVITARHDNAGYPIRAIRTYDYLYVHNFEPGRWPAGDPVNQGSITGRNFADIDPSPSKEVLLKNQYPGSPFYKQFLLACGSRPEHELYDMRRDPDCLDNIADLRKDVRDALWSRMRKLLTEQGDPRMLGTGSAFDRYSGLLVNPTPDGK